MMHHLQTATRWVMVVMLGAFVGLAQTLRAQVTINPTTFTVGASVGNNTVVTNWVGSPFSVNAPIYVYHTGNNSVTVSNFVISHATLHSYLGFGTSNNVLTLLTNTTWNLATRILYVGEKVTAGNGLIVDGGVVSNLSLYIGSSAAVAYRSISNQVIVQNGGLLTNVQQLVLGHLPGGEFNSLIVTNGGRYIQSAGDFLIGGGFNGIVGGGNNFAILSNSLVTITGSSNFKNIGSGSSNNTVTLLGNTVWNQGNAALTIGGNSNAGTGNVLTLNGSIFTNATAMTVGSGPSAVNSGNALIVTNAGQLFVGVSGITIGTGGSRSNKFVINGGASTGAFVTNAGALTIGNTSSDNNAMTVTNARLITGTGTIGNGSSGNSATVSANASWDLRATTLTIGYGTAADNRLTVDSGILTNVGSLIVGNLNGSVRNGLVITNGGFVQSATTYISSTSAGAIGSTNNFVTVAGVGSVWSNSSNFFLSGQGSVGSNNYLTVASGGQAIFGSTVAGNALQVGFKGAFNVATVTDSGSVVRVSDYLVVGGGSGTPGGWIGNRLVITNRGLVIANGGTIGSEAGANSNGVIVTGLGSIWTNAGPIIVGKVASANSNYLNIADGGAVFATALTAGGAASANNNSVLITNALLEANTLAISASTTGNTISNRNATYQFTAAPTVTTQTPGDIAITDGTISFRATGVANVTNTVANHISRIRFAGANTFTLNNASNTAAAVSQTYTFNSIPGNPSNYVNLVMVNGSTAYGNSAGANITIGSAGSMLVSNTTATISGLLTNSGSLSVVNARATFQNRVYNSGTSTMLNSVGTFNSGVINVGRWLTDPTTNVLQGFGFTNTISGVISMAAGDVFVFTNTLAGTPANFVNVSTNNVANDLRAGKFLFSGGLGLTQTFATAGHDLGPTSQTATNIAYAYSSVPGMVNNFALGTLEISNFSTVRVTDAFLDIGTNDFLMAALYLDNLFLGPNSLLIIATNVQVYFRNSNNWSLANIRLENNQGAFFGDAYDYNNSISGLHQVTVIPEPSVVLLWGAGFFTLALSRRRSRRASR